MFMNDIQSIDEKYNKIYNSSVYILDNSTYYKYGKSLFNISGEINDTQPKLENKNLTVMINLASDIKKETEVKCTINNKTRQNYILNCKANETFESDLQSSVSFIDNGDILLINFANNDSIIFVEETKYMRTFFRKNKINNLGAGVIVGLILTLIVVIALVIFFIIYRRKENKKFEFEPDSSIGGLKKFDFSKNK